MKHSIVRWGLVLSLLLTLVTVGAGATGTVSETHNEKAPTAPTCNHANWEVLAPNESISAGGNYYLADDGVFTGLTSTSSSVAPLVIDPGADNEVVLCLNGKTLTYSSGSADKLIHVKSGDVTICDCKKTNVITAGVSGTLKYALSVASGAEVTLFDVNIRDCYSKYGTVYTGAGSATSHATINFVSGQVTNNTFDQASGSFNIAAYNVLNMWDGAKITNNTPTHATRGTGGVYISGSGTVTGSGGIFNMYGGEISGNTAIGGGGVALYRHGTFNMYGGNISGNSAQNGGGVYLYRLSTVNYPTFNMHGGTIGGTTVTFPVNQETSLEEPALSFTTGNHATTSGGGVYLEANCIFNMIGGEIIGNAASNVADKGNDDNEVVNGGGGVCTAGVFSMSGGSIKGNTTQFASVVDGNGTYLASGQRNAAVCCGGGVFVKEGGTLSLSNTGVIAGNVALHGGGVHNRGTFNMTGGTIGGSETADQNVSLFIGAGVYLTKGTFNLGGGIITGNYAPNNAGGGVSVAAGGSADAPMFSMSGGSITKNAAKSGGGVNVTGYATVSGGTITDNTLVSGNGKDVYVQTAGNLTVSGGDIGANKGQDRIVVYANSGKTPVATINGGIIGGIKGFKLGSADQTTSYATVTINGGTITDKLGSTTAAGVVFNLNGGIYHIPYEAGRTNATAGSKPGYTEFVIDDSKEFKPYDGKYLLAEASTGTNMNIGKDLKANIYLPKGAVEAATASATIGGANVAATLNSVTEGEGETAQTIYVVTVPVAAKQMAEEIAVVLKDAKGNVINVETDSVKAYGKRVLDDDSKSAAHTVIVDMLNYGAAAQKYFGYKTEALANADITTAGTDGAALLAAAANNPDLNRATSRAYHSANLTLDDQVDFNLYFWVGQIGETKAYTYSGPKDGSGVFEDYLDTGADEKLLYKVKIEDLTVADLANAKVTFNFQEKGESKIITDSVFNYLVRNNGYARDSQEENSDTSGLYAALMAFADSASKYNPGGATASANGTPITA